MNAPDVEDLSELTPEDEARLVELSRLLTSEAVFDSAAIRAGLRLGMLRIFVLREEGRIIASASAVRFATPTGIHCRIEDVVVDPACRGKGLGRLIMEGALAALARSGLQTVELTSRPSRVAANALYRALGFRPRETNVYEYELIPQGRKGTA